VEPIIWVAFGLVAGWIAGLLMKGGGYGLVGDLAVGILGAIVCAWLFVFIVPAEHRSGLVGTALVAVAGAVGFVGLARLLTRRVVHA
jgi:uncharacterized membrane protein YeaQ/YmgE (transglycosylase-associated protein family)